MAVFLDKKKGLNQACPYLEIDGAMPGDTLHVPGADKINRNIYKQKKILCKGEVICVKPRPGSFKYWNRD